MNYTNNQIKRILAIQEFLGTTNSLSKIYSEYDNKEFTVENIIEKQRIYRLFCSAMYNLIDAVKKSNEIFGKTKSYSLFQKISIKNMWLIIVNIVRKKIMNQIYIKY